jgi:HSP20 family molecular chaperone IbpA
MAVMLMVGNGHQLSPHAQVREEAGEYVIELDVSGFTASQLTVEARGPMITVRGDQLEANEGFAFHLHERLEESFRLPDDADADHIKVFCKHEALAIHAPRTRLERRLLPIEHPCFAVNPDAEAC